MYWIPDGFRSSPSVTYFECEFVSDIANLPTKNKNGVKQDDAFSYMKCSPGSQCKCYEDKNVYMLAKKTDTWVIWGTFEPVIEPDPEPEPEPSTGGNCNCDSDEHIQKIVEKTKPLVFNSVSEANTELNSGSDKVKNIYLGETVLVIENGKYVLYSIQQGTNGYVVEPVDTNDGGGSTQPIALEWVESV